MKATYSYATDQEAAGLFELVGLNTEFPENTVNGESEKEQYGPDTFDSYVEREINEIAAKLAKLQENCNKELAKANRYHKLTLIPFKLLGLVMLFGHTHSAYTALSNKISPNKTGNIITLSGTFPISGATLFTSVVVVR